jgi:hypothetical protein
MKNIFLRYMMSLFTKINNVIFRTQEIKLPGFFI